MFTYVFCMLLMIGLFIAVAAMGIHDVIRDYKERKQKTIENNRREQLIKELKVGTFDEENMKKMTEELGNLMAGHYWHKYRCEMTRKHSGIWQLTTLKTDGYSWI